MKLWHRRGLLIAFVVQATFGLAAEMRALYDWHQNPDDPYTLDMSAYVFGLFVIFAVYFFIWESSSHD